MEFVSASLISLVFFIALLLIVWGLVINKIRKIEGFSLWSGIFLIYTLILSIGAITDLTSNHLIPVAPILFAIIMFISFSLSFSAFGKRLAQEFSYAQILGLQSFRFPLEIILAMWGSTKTIPMTMTWSGQNLDIITGILCLITIPLLNKHKSLVWGVQLISFGLLLNVLRVVIMSSPFPFSWKLETPLIIIGQFPYALIVPGFVGLAFISHLLVFRKLLQK